MVKRSLLTNFQSHSPLILTMWRKRWGKLITLAVEPFPRVMIDLFLSRAFAPVEHTILSSLLLSHYKVNLSIIVFLTVFFSLPASFPVSLIISNDISIITYYEKLDFTYLTFYNCFLNLFPIGLLIWTIIWCLKIISI